VLHSEFDMHIELASGAIFTRAFICPSFSI